MLGIPNMIFGSLSSSQPGMQAAPMSLCSQCAGHVPISLHPFPSVPQQTIPLTKDQLKSERTLPSTKPRIEHRLRDSTQHKSCMTLIQFLLSPWPWTHPMQPTTWPPMDQPSTSPMAPRVSSPMSLMGSSCSLWSWRRGRLPGVCLSLATSPALTRRMAWPASRWSESIWTYWWNAPTAPEPSTVPGPSSAPLLPGQTRRSREASFPPHRPLSALRICDCCAQTFSFPGGPRSSQTPSVPSSFLSNDPSHLDSPFRGLSGTGALGCPPRASPACRWLNMGWPSGIQGLIPPSASKSDHTPQVSSGAGPAQRPHLHCGKHLPPCDQHHLAA